MHKRMKIKMNSGTYMYKVDLIKKKKKKNNYSKPFKENSMS